MTWFELRSPHKITLSPSIVYIPSGTQPTVAKNTTYITSGIDQIANYVNYPSSSHLFVLTHKDARGPGSEALPLMGNGACFLTGLYDTIANRRVFGACARPSLPSGAENTGYRIGASHSTDVTDMTAHCIAAMLDAAPDALKSSVYSVQANITDPYLVPFYLNGASSPLQVGDSASDKQYLMNKYFEVERTSGGDNAGDFTITFKGLSMSKPPYIALTGQAYDTVAGVHVQSVTTSGFRLRTSVSTTATDLVVGGFILFSGRGSAQRQKNIVKFPYRNAQAWLGCLDLADTAGYGQDLLPEFRELFQTRTVNGTGDFTAVFKSHWTEHFNNLPGLILTVGSNADVYARMEGGWTDGETLRLGLYSRSAAASDYKGTFFAFNWGDRTNY